MITHALPLAVGAGGAEPVRSRALQVWWAIYLLLNPLYLFPSGGLQPAHLFLVSTFPIAFALWLRRLPHHPDLYLAAGGFLAYAVLINTLCFMQYYSSEFLMSSCYTAYNMIILAIIAAAFRDRASAMAQTTRAVLLVTLAGEAAFVLVVGDQGYGRAMGTFNDPNQMGYWALLTAVSFFVVREGRALRLADLLALLLAGLVIFFSVSRAAILGFSTLVALVALFSRFNPRRVLAGLAVLVVAIMLTRMVDVGLDQSYQSVLDFAEKRFASKDTANDSLAERGYARLWLFPDYLLFGAGDGLYPQRFNLANETHSTIGSILFAYGIVGLTLFSILLYVLVRRANWFRITLLLPIMIYGIAQQGVRFSMFWTFLALVFAMSHTEDDHEPVFVKP